MKNKVEAQPRKVNKKNRAVEPIHDDNVKHSLFNANSICATFRFRNDHIARIMGYGDCQLGNVAISRVYYVKSLGHGLHSMTPVTSSSGLVPNTVSQQHCIPPNRDDWDRLFQPMFDEYFNPLSIAVSPVQEAAALKVVVLSDSPVLTSIDQDASSTSIPSTQEQEHSPTIS
uniref:Integrase, catalytic region, zinc finger, CCHC-type, peptidase aspartic, catalytic n=1 Tax=Tanacetum cinerariifolium TaxID=118510 RepID=A0A6L2LLD3_TANCI|nr:integrase, catalytic region, zinc finger, CCHC-type, peptidase aspartic, catalytic [Tanacetum cinerariifolium]